MPSLSDRLMVHICNMTSSIATFIGKDGSPETLSRHIFIFNSNMYLDQSGNFSGYDMYYEDLQREEDGMNDGSKSWPSGFQEMKK